MGLQPFLGQHSCERLPALDSYGQRITAINQAILVTFSISNDFKETFYAHHPFTDDLAECLADYCTCETLQTMREIIMPISMMPKKTAGRKLVDVKTVADKLDCSSRHVYRMVDAGRMPTPLRLGALVRWDLDEIDRWIGTGCKPVRSLKGGTW
jgi:excisionase family DNA binding protein